MATGLYDLRDPREVKGQFVRRVIDGFVGLIFPSLFLFSIYVLSFFLIEDPVWFSFATEQPLADPAWWMTLGHLALPLAFFAVSLTNRAHGPTRSFFQVVMTWAIIAGLLAIASSVYGHGEVRAELGPSQVLMAFLLALMAAHVISLAIFDLQRGVPWWKAPLSAGLAGPLVFVLIFYPLGYSGADAPWGTWMWMHFLAMAIVSLILLIPYAVLRGVIRPGRGLGGA